MRFAHFVLFSSFLFGSAASSVAATHIRRGPTSPRAFSKRTSAVVHSKSMQGQRTIDDARATQIQGALIRAGYLFGEPSGHWDAETQAAMEKLQADNGWQTKLVPDSRALIKLGLGSSSTPVNPYSSQSSPLASNQTNELIRQ
jgi:hypothetical protein